MEIIQKKLNYQQKDPIIKDKWFKYCIWCINIKFLYTYFYNIIKKIIKKKI